MTYQELYVSEHYPLETLINGNITECITHLQQMLSLNTHQGDEYVYDSLNEIREQCPDRHAYVKKQVYSHRFKTN